MPGQNASSGSIPQNRPRPSFPALKSPGSTHTVRWRGKGKPEQQSGHQNIDFSVSPRKQRRQPKTIGTQGGAHLQRGSSQTEPLATANRPRCAQPVPGSSLRLQQEEMDFSPAQQPTAQQPSGSPQVGASCFSRGELDFSPAQQRRRPESASAAALSNEQCEIRPKGGHDTPRKRFRLERGAGKCSQRLTSNSNRTMFRLEMRGRNAGSLPAVFVASGGVVISRRAGGRLK